MNNTNFKINEEILYYYFYFIQERMNIFWQQQNQNINMPINDQILTQYKFTNVYRMLDRVSQYLIKNIIYTKEKYNEEDIIFRILLFKIFNKIETWEYLENNLGEIKLNNFDVNKYIRIIEQRQKSSPIFNNAYIMGGRHNKYLEYSKKHEVWLNILKTEIINKKFLNSLLNIDTLENLYLQLRDVSLIGDFLAYQYSIDLNYSEIFNFSENSFVKAGIGAQRGLKKCFYNLHPKEYENAIKYISNNFDDLLNYFSINNFRPLYNHQPTLIDLQNCFCETDKYLRKKVPSLIIGNTRIKQKYSPKKNKIKIFLPPKWFKEGFNG